MYIVKETRPYGELWVHLDTKDKAGVLKIKRGAVSGAIYSFEISLSLQAAKEFCNKLTQQNRNATALKVFSEDIMLEAGEFTFKIKNK